MGFSGLERQNPEQLPEAQSFVKAGQLTCIDWHMHIVTESSDPQILWPIVSSVSRALGHSGAFVFVRTTNG